MSSRWVRQSTPYTERRKTKREVMKVEVGGCWVPIRRQQRCVIFFLYTVGIPFNISGSASDGVMRTKNGSLRAGVKQRLASRARICKPFREPRYRFLAWWAGTTTIFVVSAHQVTKACGIESSESIPELHNRLQIRAQLNGCCHFRSLYSLLLWRHNDEALYSCF